MKTVSYIVFFLLVIMLLEIAISSASFFQSYGSKVILLLFTGSVTNNPYISLIYVDREVLVLL